MALCTKSSRRYNGAMEATTAAGHSVPRLRGRTQDAGSVGRVMNCQYRARRALLMPLPLFAIAGVAWVSPVTQTLGLLGFIAGFVLAVLSVPHGLFGRVSIADDHLEAVRPFGATEAPLSGVNLAELSGITSVGRKYDALVESGVAIWRPMFRLQDRLGGEAWLNAWGWDHKDDLFGVLRRSVEQSHASSDALSARRLGLDLPGLPIGRARRNRRARIVFFRRRLPPVHGD